MSEGKKQTEQTGKRIGQGKPGPGRPKGSLDKGNALIREMIVQALDRVGGVAYLEDKAQTHPQAFLALIAKVMPVQVEGGTEPIKHSIKVSFE